MACWLVQVSIVLLHLRSAFAECYNPTSPYPPPTLHILDPALRSVFSSIERDLHLAKPEIPELDVAFSIEVTSANETLWSFHQRASEETAIATRDCSKKTQNGKVNEHSVYRIASITKIFTLLAALEAHEKGLLDLDKPITEYVAELRQKGKCDLSGSRTKWDHITLRSLASQLSGIRRESAKMTLAWSLNSQPDPVSAGYPPLGLDDLPSCGHSKDSFVCSREEIMDELLSQRPVYHPNFKSTYSNMAFVLLAMAVENVTGLAYKDVIRKWIFEPLNMTDSSIEKPDDSRGQILSGQSTWGVNLGLYNATGGIYSSSHSMSRLLRYILSSQSLRDQWLHPHSFTSGGGSFYGMPWEIYNSPKFLPDHGHRPTTFYTKSGGIGGYYSNIILMPEQGLGITILVAGTLIHVKTMEWIREVVTKRLTPAVEDAALEQTRARYAGTYAHPGPALNSQLTLAVSHNKGLYISHWTSNGTEFLAQFGAMYQRFERPRPWHAQVVPSFLQLDDDKASRRHGEVWRVRFVPEKEPGPLDSLWGEFCSDDISGLAYGGRDINELVFEMEDGEMGRAVAVTVEGLRVRMEKVRDDSQKKPAELLQSTSSEALWRAVKETTQRVLGFQV